MSNFDVALEFTLRHEGGFVNHPRDPGGATNRGITQAAYDRHRRRLGLDTRSVRSITTDEVRAIYHRDYWLAAGCNELPAPRATALFDATVHSGIGYSLRWDHDASGDWRRQIAIRQRFLTNLGTWPTFGRGWARRVADLTDLAADLADAAEARTMIVYDAAGREAAQLPINADLLLRVTPTRIYARPDPLGGAE